MLRPQPDAAESCGFSDTGTKVCTRTLRDRPMLANGEPCTSNDATFDRLLKTDGPAVMSPP
ncbi:hypothetical protein [Streptomyces sp. NPDC058726]|uniref:hypothetical protein n=1 Tax=Streptomyces sp. NPDC058726 TaxID=3346611 RepID=UPI003698475A